MQKALKRQQSKAHRENQGQVSEDDKEIKPPLIPEVY